MESIRSNSEVSIIYKPHHNPPQIGEEIPFLMFIGPPHTGWDELKLKRFLVEFTINHKPVMPLTAASRFPIIQIKSGAAI